MKNIIALTVLIISTGMLRAQTNTFPSSGNVGIGTTTPAAKLSFNNVDDGTNQPDGIAWYNPDPMRYGIYRTAGTWAAPDYQQLKLSFETGIILDPGTAYGKSYVDVRGGGLRVSSGNVGIGTETPQAKLHIVNGDLLLQNQTSGYPILWLKDVPGATTLRVDYNSILGTGSKLIIRSDETHPIVLNDVGGNVGIGTTAPNEKLTVNGTIYGKEVKVDLSVPGPDYVFEQSYNLPTLEEIKAYIDEHKHLPDVPSANEMKADGIKLAEMNMILLKKVEELTLYIMQQQQEIDKLKKTVYETK